MACVVFAAFVSIDGSLLNLQTIGNWRNLRQFLFRSCLRETSSICMFHTLRHQRLTMHSEPTCAGWLLSIILMLSTGLSAHLYVMRHTATAARASSFGSYSVRICGPSNYLLFASRQAI